MCALARACAYMCVFEVQQNNMFSGNWPNFCHFYFGKAFKRSFGRTKCPVLYVNSNCPLYVLCCNERDVNVVTACHNDSLTYRHKHLAEDFRHCSQDASSTACVRDAQPCFSIARCWRRRHEESFTPGCSRRAPSYHRRSSGAYCL